MIDTSTALKASADLKAMLAGYDILPESITLHLGFARTKEPQLFYCGKCGASYTSVWVAKHLKAPLCDTCITNTNRTTRCVEPRPPYPMPPMYARDGSYLLPDLCTWFSAPLPAMAILIGGPGRGKTAQAHHLAAFCHSLSKTVRILGDRELLRLEAAELDACAKADLVIVDELGRRTTENVLSNICEVIDRRVIYDRKTVIITNLQGEDLGVLDARFISRAKLAKRIPFTGPDLRRPA
jgi:hypothetical protein